MKDYHINIFYSDEDGGYIGDIPDLKASLSGQISLSRETSVSVFPVCRFPVMTRKSVSSTRLISAAFRTWPLADRELYRVGNSNVSRWLAHWRCGPSFCCSTSRWAAST